jgi:hypothetical protein
MEMEVVIRLSVGNQLGNDRFFSCGQVTYEFNGQMVGLLEGRFNPYWLDCWLMP